MDPEAAKDLSQTPDKSQRLKADRRLGVAIIRWQYDGLGREIDTQMFDRNELPVSKPRR